MEKKIQVAGKEYTLDYTQENDHWFCKIIEIGQMFTTKTEEEIEKKGITFVIMWNRHNAIRGIKNLKIKRFSFKIKELKFDITFMTPYASKYWFWHYFIYDPRIATGFVMRILGCNMNIRKSNPDFNLEN